MKKYTLDQIIGNQYVFLERPDEITQLIIPKEKININLSEGDIVIIKEIGPEYYIDILEVETKITLEKVNALLEKLQSKSKS